LNPASDNPERICLVSAITVSLTYCSVDHFVNIVRVNAVHVSASRLERGIWFDYKNAILPFCENRLPPQTWTLTSTSHSLRCARKAIVTDKYLFLYTPNPVDNFFSQSSGHFTNYSPNRTSESFVQIIEGSNSGDGLIHCPDEQCVEDSSE